MKRIVILLPFLFGCSQDVALPKFESFKLYAQDSFEICFDKPYEEDNIMLAMVIANQDGSVIDRKWHDEYQQLFDGTMENGENCYRSSFLSFMSAANSTPKKILNILHEHNNTKVESIHFSIATSKKGKYRNRIVDEVYIEGDFSALTKKVKLKK